MWKRVRCHLDDPAAFVPAGWSITLIASVKWVTIRYRIIRFASYQVKTGHVAQLTVASTRCTRGSMLQAYWRCTDVFVSFCFNHKTACCHALRLFSLRPIALNKSFSERSFLLDALSCEANQCVSVLWEVSLDTKSYFVRVDKGYALLAAVLEKLGTSRVFSWRPPLLTLKDSNLSAIELEWQLLLARRNQRAMTSVADVSCLALPIGAH